MAAAIAQAALLLPCAQLRLRGEDCPRLNSTTDPFAGYVTRFEIDEAYGQKSEQPCDADKLARAKQVLLVGASAGTSTERIRSSLEAADALSGTLSEVEPADRARVLAEGISCVINVLAPLAWPERFGALSAENRALAVEHVAELRAALVGDLSNIQTDVNMGKLLTLLPEIELALAEPCDPEEQAHVAREFFAALHIDPQALGQPQ